MTANPLRAARGTTATLETRALLDGELAKNTTTNRLHYGDGSTVGGIPLASQSDGDDISVTATGSTTARTLADRFAETISPEDEGAGGAGSTNDEDEAQSALDGVGHGDAVRGVPGSIYSAANLTLPTVSAAGDSGHRNSIFAPGGMSIFKARSGGDADYFIATDRWLTGNADKDEPGTPWGMMNIVVDANGIAEKGVVYKSYLGQFMCSTFLGATETDFEFTRQNQDNTNGATVGVTPQYLSDNMWFANRFIGDDCTYQFRARGTNADDLDAPSDGWLIFNAFNGRAGADYGVQLGSGAGWIGIGNRVYNHTTAGANVKRLGRGFLWSLNNMDSDGTAPAMIVGAVGSYPFGVIGPGNQWYADLRLDFKADASAERIIVSADHFYTQQAGSPDAVVIHNNNNANKIVTILNSVFEADPIYERGVGNTAGIVEAYNCFSASASGANQFIAALRDDPGATAGPVLRYVRRSASAANNDVLARLQFEGDDANGTLFTYAATEAAINDNTASAPDGLWRVKLLKDGIEVTAFTVTPGGTTMSLAGGGSLGRSVSGEGAVTDALIRYSGDASPPNAALQKARGTIASPSSVAQFDELGRLSFVGYGGGAFRDAAYLRAFVVAATPSNTDMESDARVYVAAASSVTPTEILRLRHSTGLSMFGANVVVDAARGIRFPPYSATNIADKTHAVNTAQKAQGKAVYDTTNHRIMVADGSTDVSLWYVADGSASVTPA